MLFQPDQNENNILIEYELHTWHTDGLLTAIEDEPYSSSSLIESTDEYCGGLTVSVSIGVSLVGSSSSSVPSLPVATLKSKTVLIM